MLCESTVLVYEGLWLYGTYGQIHWSSWNGVLSSSCPWLYSARRHRWRATGHSSSAVTGGSSDAARLVYSSGLGCSRSQPCSVTTNWCEISFPKRPTADIYMQSKLQLSHYASWCVHNTIQLLFLQIAMRRVYYVCYFRQQRTLQRTYALL